MRPLFYDFPEDPRAWEIEDEYMFGSDMLICPILYENMREREVYLPAGRWRNINDQEIYEGGRTYTCAAPIDEIPVFVREGTLEMLYLRDV
jgi:alpha-D-xyloside xylohydrolase